MSTRRSLALISMSVSSTSGNTATVTVGMDAALAFSDQDALWTRWTPPSIQFGVWCVALDHENNYFIPPESYSRFADELGFVFFAGVDTCGVQFRLNGDASSL